VRSRTPRASSPAVAVLVDYDGTVVTRDISDDLVRRFASVEAWAALDSAYRRGDIGSRALLEAETQLLPREPAVLAEVVMPQPLDPGFRTFVEFARSIGIAIEVVSDGLGFFVATGLADLGFGDLPVYAAEMVFGSTGPAIRFPNGHPICMVCGTCKRDRILTHQASGRHVIYVGDGHSDQYAAAYADTLFAKSELADLCDRRGIAYQPWTTFSDIQIWLDRALRRADLGMPPSRPFICGPEAQA
jgi:2-hydroxy-3-keto-5-methylthiopentenyl-1-phosphate phosphatase